MPVRLRIRLEHRHQPGEQEAGVVERGLLLRCAPRHVRPPGEELVHRGEDERALLVGEVAAAFDRERGTDRHADGVGEVVAAELGVLLQFVEHGLAQGAQRGAMRRVGGEVGELGGRVVADLAPPSLRHHGVLLAAAAGAAGNAPVLLRHRPAAAARGHRDAG
ncbi:MAG: hypothetical protein RML45_16220 [Acetobacteraceae bacterium]|nr:hypothetical protein [Acetobacteraceae bacterium]